MVFLRKSSWLLPVISSLLLWLAFPGGGGVWPVLIVALVPLLRSLDLPSQSIRTTAAHGLVFGVLHFLFLLYWIIIVLESFGGLPWLVAAIALLLLSVYLGSYFALFALGARYILRSFPAFLSLWIIPALWVGLDWLRGWLFTGFPWMDMGYALFQHTLLIQIADLAGHHGITFLIVFVNVLLYLIVQQKRSCSCYAGLLLSVLVLFGSAGLYSKARLSEMQAQLNDKTLQRISLGIVQGNIDQSLKWSEELQQATVENYTLLTESLFSSGRPALVIWPETALPFYPPSNAQMQPLQQMVVKRDFALLSGAPWYEIINLKEKKVTFFNSAFLLEASGDYGDRYSKTHLVPFGEYVPFKKFLPFIAPLVESVGDFTPGVIEHTIDWQTAKTGILICFESVFPDLSRQWVLAGANVLVNLTNDAWYGRSSAPQQSLAMTVLRAVETRRSVARSANTGISAFISPTGDIVQHSDLFVPWAAVDEVVLIEEQTVWVRIGYLFGPICLLVGFAAGSVALLRKKSRSAIH